MAEKKAIVDIDLKDDKFVRFKAMFDKYQTQLGKVPAQWAAVGSAQASASATAAKGFASEAEGIAAITVALSGVVKQQNEVVRVGRGNNSMLKDAGRLTGTILSNVAGTTLQLLKWAALGGVVGAATGLFGVDALARSGGNLRRQAQGLSATPGQLRAARANLGNYIDVEGTLGALAAAQSDPRQAGYLRAMGVSGEASAGDALPDLLRRGVQTYKQRGLLGFNALGYGSVLGAEDARRLAGLSAGEMEDALKGYKRDSTELNSPDDQLRALQKLTNQFDRAGDKIENVFIRALARVSPQLEHLSDSVVKALGIVSDKVLTGDNLDKLGSGIQWLATYLSGDELKSDVRDFLALVHKLAHPLDWAASANPLQDVGTDTGVVQALGDAADRRRAWDKEHMSPGAFGLKYGSSAPSDAPYYLSPSARNTAGSPSARSTRAPAEWIYGKDTETGLIPRGSDPLTWTPNGLPYKQSGLSPREMYRRASDVKVIIQNQTGGDAVVQTSQLAH